jgi:hypothetical protein
MLKSSNNFLNPCISKLAAVDYHHTQVATLHAASNRHPASRSAKDLVGSIWELGMSLSSHMVGGSWDCKTRTSRARVLFQRGTVKCPSVLVLY